MDRGNPLIFNGAPAVLNDLNFLDSLDVRDWRGGMAKRCAIGIALDTIYSKLAGFLPEADCSRILALLEALGFDLWAPELGVHLEDETPPRTVLRGSTSSGNISAESPLCSLENVPADAQFVCNLPASRTRKAYDFPRRLCVPPF